MQLSARRSKFVDEYVIDCNGSAAARRAGYGVAGARVTAHRLLTNANVLAAIEAKQRDLAQEYELDKHRVVAELLDAVAVARNNLDAGSMIRGWVEVAKVLGINTPEIQKIEITAANEVLRAKYEAMSDEELLAIA